MKFNYPINNFGAGEWSPKMQSRTDAEQYPRSCKELTNMMVQMQGGAQYRGGTLTHKIALQATQDAYNALLVANTDPTKDFKMVEYSSSALEDIVIITTGVAPTVFSGLNVTVTGDAWPAFWLPELTQYAQVGDYLFLTETSGAYKPRVIYYDAFAGQYYIKIFDNVNSRVSAWQANPWGDLEALGTSVTLTPSAATGTITITASSSYFKNDMIGAYVRLCSGASDEGVALLTAFTSSTVMTAVVQKTLPITTAYGGTAAPTTFWQASQWSNANGWPKTVVAFQGRVIYGGNMQKPDTIWGSRIGNIFNLQEIPSPNTTGVGGFASGAYLSDNSRPFTLTPNGAQSAKITALSAAKTLNIHTNKAEIVAAGANGAALGPVNVSFESSTSFGASAVQPIRVNNFSTFVQGNGYKVRDIVYNFNEDQYKSQDLTFLAEHLFIRSTAADIPNSLDIRETFFPVDDIIELCRYEARSSFLLVKTRMGRLYYVTLDRDYSVNAWGRIVLGSETEETYPYNAQPVVLAVCTLLSEVYVMVKRVFNGTAVVRIERLTRSWEYDNNSATTTHPRLPFPVYLDCSIYATVVGVAPATTWKVGLYHGGHLYGEGTVLSVIADGNYVGEITIPVGDTSGNFTLAVAASNVLVGFKYKGVLTTAGIETGGQFGQPLGRLKRVNDVAVKLFKTGSAKIGKDLNNLEEIVIRQPSVPMDQPTPYFTGNKLLTFSQGYEGDYSITVVQDKPYPLYVVSVTANGVSDD